MGEYTEQDAELIIGAVMASASHVERDTPTLCNQIQTTVKLILDGVISSSSHDPYALDLVSVARLMRATREQGIASVAIDRDRLAWLEKWYPGQEEQNRHLHQSIAKQKTKHAAALIQSREQGAAEMRAQVIAALRALPDGTWGDERGERSPWPDAIDAVKALKVPQ